jgi:hypothetical protein
VDDPGVARLVLDADDLGVLGQRVGDDEAAVDVQAAGGDLERLGSPSTQPSENSGAGGRSSGSPSGMPASAQAWKVSTCSSVRLRSWRNGTSPKSGEASQGGIRRSSVTVARSKP